MERPIKKSPCVTLFIAGLFLVLWPAAAEEQAKAEKESKVEYSGSLRTTYDYRGLGSYADQDAQVFWYLRGRDLADERVDIYTSGRLHSDLDGTSASYDPFGSISDDSQSDIRLLQLYIDLHDRKREKALRIGRQYVDVADYIQMDGLQGQLFEKQKLGGRVFLGQPVSDYTSVSGDIFFGASLVGRPWKGNRTRATYARYEDDDESAEDDHYFLDMHQHVAEDLRTRAYLSVMNGDVRMGGADLFYISHTDKVFDAVLGIRRWGEYAADTRAYSPLVQVLADQEPYTTAHGRCTAQVLPWFYLSPGVMVRRSDDSDFTNRRFERHDLNFIFEPMDDLSASVALEYWDVEEGDRFWGLSGDIRYRHRKLWEVSAGAAFLDYTYLQLSDTSVFTDDDVFPPVITPLDGNRVERSPFAFTYFLKAKWNISKNMILRLSGELEDDSTEEHVGYRVRTSFEVRL